MNKPCTAAHFPYGTASSMDRALWRNNLLWHLSHGGSIDPAALVGIFEPSEPELHEHPVGTFAHAKPEDARMDTAGCS